MNVRAGSFVHEACVYASDEEFLAMAVPFANDGLAAGHPVVAVTTPHNIALLRRTVEDAGRVEFIEATQWYTTPGRTAASYYDRVRRHRGPGRLRVIGEVVWQGRSSDAIREWKRYESSLNVTFADTFAWIICPYDARVLPRDVVEDAKRTHPARIDGLHSTACREYVDPEVFIGDREAMIMSEPPPDAEQLPVCDLYGVRRAVVSWATRHGMAEERMTSLAAAVSEAADFLIGQGDGRLEVRMWRQAELIVCSLHAPGARTADALAGYRPPGLDPHPGDGLWLTRYLCDFVDIYPGEPGCSVHVEMSCS